jgi:hypothetical protein
MKDKFKEITSHIKDTLETVEEKVEKYIENLSEETYSYWKTLKEYLQKTGSELKERYEEQEGEAELQAHLFAMEAKEKLASLQDEITLLVDKAAGKSAQELDILALKAHLAKLEGETLLEEKEKAFRHLYAQSKLQAQDLSHKTLKEINDIYVKLTEVI